MHMNYELVILILRNLRMQGYDESIWDLMTEYYTTHYNFILPTSSVDSYMSPSPTSTSSRARMHSGVKSMDEVYIGLYGNGQYQSTY